MAAYRVVRYASGYGVRRVLCSERMILGSKHVVAILSVLMRDFM